MKSKEKVQAKYPNARAHKITGRGPFAENYYLIFQGYYSNNPIRLNDGEGCNTESKAWTQAAKNL